MPSKVSRKFEDRRVLLADTIQNANCANPSARQPDNLPPRTAQLPLQRLHSLDRRMEVLLEELFENIHGSENAAIRPGSATKITSAPTKTIQLGL